MIKVLYHSNISHIKMGGQKSLVSLIENLDRSLIDVHVIIRDYGELKDKLDSIDVKTYVKITPGFKIRKIIQVVREYYKLKRFIKMNEFHIIHSDYDKFIYLTSKMTKKLKTKTVFHARVAKAYKYDKLLEKKVDAIIGVSEAVFDRFDRSLTNKFHKIYNGVDCELFKPVASKADKKKELGLDGSTPLLIFVGQIKEGKGLFDIIEAINILKKENKAEFLCLFIGEEAEKEGKDKFITKIKENGLEEKIKLVGQKENIQDWMQGADILMLTSHEGVEGMGRVLFEAMACGTAVIGSDTSGVNEAVTLETGILVPEKSPKDLAKAIDKILSDDELRKGFEIEGRKRALEHFDIRVHAKKIMDLYQVLIK